MFEIDAPNNANTPPLDPTKYVFGSKTLTLKDAKGNY